jgi:hypothetical protein
MREKEDRCRKMSDSHTPGEVFDARNVLLADEPPLQRQQAENTIASAVTTIPLTVQALRGLRTADARAQTERLVRQYAAAIRTCVLEEAKHGSASYALFWLVTPEVARVQLKHITGQFYPWNTKYIRRSGFFFDNGLFRRPVPYELIVPIGERLGSFFPDATISIVDSPFQLGYEYQKFLTIRW